MFSRINSVFLRCGAWLVLGLPLTGCSTSGHQAEATEHPLVGRIWDVRQEEFLTPESLKARAVRAQHLLLGETHINPEHHRIQAEMIQALADDGGRLALVFEIFERDQQHAIDRATSGPGADADDVAEATGIEDTGWDWDLYRPLVEAALAARIPVLAGNAPREEVRRIAYSGLDSVPAERQVELGLTQPLPGPAHEALTQTIIDSHCGHVYGDMTERLVDAQRIRDATMAEVMLQAEPGKTVLIAGGGHARRDYGVPHYILDRTPDADVIAIGLTEVLPELSLPEAYLDRLPGLDVSFDYLWFTDRTMTEDPCEEFRESLEKLGTHGQKR